MKKIFVAALLSMLIISMFAGCKKEPPVEEAPVEEEVPVEQPEPQVPAEKPPHVHSYTSWRTIKQASCTEAGVLTRNCRDCGNVERQNVNATGHKPSDWVVDALSDCVNDGERHKSCTVCKEELEREKIALLGHDYIETLVYPNRREEGYTLHVCNRCNDVYEDTETPAWGRIEFLYTVNSDGKTCTINDIVLNEAVELHIPVEIAGYSVVALGDGALQDEDELTVVRIPDSVQSIGNDAFSGCTMLSEIVIGSGVKTIGDRAFASCVSLGEISIPETVENIGAGAFYSCTKLEHVEIPNGVTEISASLFEKCRGLKSVSFGEWISSVGDYAFSDCYLLSSIPQLSSAAYIGDYAFAYCANLTSITFGESLERIGASAFVGVDSLAEVNIPTVDFWYTIKFENGEANPLNVNAKLYWGKKILVSSANIPSDISCVPDYLFFGYDHLTAAILSKNTSEFGAYTFSGCTALSSVEINCEIYSVPEYTFYGCASLRNITLPSSTAMIGEYAFAQCKSLSKMSLPEAVYYIGEYAFEGCTSLSSITIPESVTEINDYVFRNCTKLSAAELHSAITEIGTGAFAGCSALANLVIPEGVVRIGRAAFDGAISLKSVTIPESVKSIGFDAFANCNDVKALYVSDIYSWLRIDFENVDSNPIASETVIYVQDEILSSIVITEAAKEISDYSLMPCASVKAVYYTGSSSEFEAIATEENLLLKQMLDSNTVYYYSATAPEAEGNFWYYNAFGQVSVW